MSDRVRRGSPISPTSDEQTPLTAREISMLVTLRRAGGRVAFAIALTLAAWPAMHGQDTTKTAAARRAGEARVQPGDRVSVKIYREPGLSDEVLVNPRGDIVLAKIGTVHATNVAIDALQDTLKARYATYLRNPDISMTVLRRVVVNGEVRRPDIYFVDLSSTLRDVIARAGGITEVGNPKNVSIVREGVVIPAPHWQDDVTKAADLQSGDQVVVGMRSWFERNAFALASTGVLVASFVLSLRHP
jgi:polysaccharide export outer membrane protein